MPPVNDSKLPEFDNPPLTEVVLSAQFEPLPGLSIPQIGRLWQEYETSLPRVEQRPPIEPIIERVGVKSPSFWAQWETLHTMPIPRVWFMDKDGRELIQIQQDRFIRNWKKVGPEDIYPRYEKHIRPRFVEDINKFIAFADKNGLGAFLPNQCEVSYINHILSGDTWADHSELNRVFNLWSTEYQPENGLQLETVRFAMSHQIVNEQGEFIGRLHVTVEPAFSPSEKSKPVFVLNMIARGRPLSDGIDGILSFFDLGRIHIVKTFKRITTKRMHEEWRLKHV